VGRQTGKISHMGIEFVTTELVLQLACSEAASAQAHFRSTLAAEGDADVHVAPVRREPLLPRTAAVLAEILKSQCLISIQNYAKALK
jgi:hypothetical protein